MIWAFSGILLRHLKQENLTQLYPSIYITVAICIAYFIVVNDIVLFRSIK